MLLLHDLTNLVTMLEVLQPCYVNMMRKYLCNYEIITVTLGDVPLQATRVEIERHVFCSRGFSKTKVA